MIKLLDAYIGEVERLFTQGSVSYSDLSEVCDLMEDFLTRQGWYVAETRPDLREMALNNTDLMDPDTIPQQRMHH